MIKLNKLRLPVFTYGTKTLYADKAVVNYGEEVGAFQNAQYSTDTFVMPPKPILIHSAKVELYMENKAGLNGFGGMYVFDVDSLEIQLRKFPFPVERVKPFGLVTTDLEETFYTTTPAGSNCEISVRMGLQVYNRVKDALLHTSQYFRLMDFADKPSILELVYSEKPEL